jgi:glycosyltransferase involved in cell wall biosynthesis
MGISPIAKSKPIKLVYIVGRYPELTTTFIEREINKLMEVENIKVQPISIRYPITPITQAPEHEVIKQDTLYLIPKKWSDFDFFAFFSANLYYLFVHPRNYWETLIYLLSHPHPSLSTRFLTIIHFGLGVYAAYLLRKRDFYHLHAHFIDRGALVALVVSRLLKKTYSLTAHAVDIYTKKILIKEKLINAQFVVTVSEYNKAHFLNTYPGLNAGKIHVLHPWVDPVNFIPLNPRRSQDRFHILSVGRLVEKKGFGDLITACSLLLQQGLDFECRIVGDGPLKVQLMELIIGYELQDQVFLTGGQSQSHVLQLLGSWADIFALPCVIAQDGDRDGIPVALAEAMAMELPVISTCVVGIPELVKPEAGILVPSHDPVALSKAIKQIFDKSPSARLDMGRRGRAIVVNEFNLLKGTSQLADLFLGLVV